MLLTKRPASEVFKSFRKKKRKAKKDDKSARKSRCGACIISQCGTRCLLVKQKEAQKWSFPKGSKEKYETKEDCMTRELLEETGIHLKDYKYKILDCVKRYRYYIFILRLQNTEKNMVLSPHDKHEIEKAKWVDFTDLSLYTMNYVTKSIMERSPYIASLTGNDIIESLSADSTDDSNNDSNDESTDLSSGSSSDKGCDKCSMEDGSKFRSVTTLLERSERCKTSSSKRDVITDPLHALISCK